MLIIEVLEYQNLIIKLKFYYLLQEVFVKAILKLIWI